MKGSGSMIAAAAMPAMVLQTLAPSAELETGTTATTQLAVANPEEAGHAVMCRIVDFLDSLKKQATEFMAVRIFVWVLGCPGK